MEAVRTDGVVEVDRAGPLFVEEGEPFAAIVFDLLQYVALLKQLLAMAGSDVLDPLDRLGDRSGCGANS